MLSFDGGDRVEKQVQYAVLANEQFSEIRRQGAVIQLLAFRLK